MFGHTLDVTTMAMHVRVCVPMLTFRGPDHKRLSMTASSSDALLFFHPDWVNQWRQCARCCERTNETEQMPDNVLSTWLDIIGCR